MNTQNLLFLCALFFCYSIANATEFRTFTDTKGRQMEAKITRISGKDVYIERIDGLNTRVDRSIFSAEDQTYITEWEYNALLKSGIFDVRFSRQQSGKNDYTRGGIMYEEYNMHFDVVITNNDYDTDFKDIRVEYLILKFEDVLSAKKRSNGVIRRFKGTSTHELINAREEVRVSTEKFPMLETELAPGYVWSNGGKEKSKDVIKGIWVKIYVGDKLVHEMSKPENMMRKETW